MRNLNNKIKKKINIKSPKKRKRGNVEKIIHPGAICYQISIVMWLVISRVDLYMKAEW